jgi:hypothetical protein
LKEEDKLSTYFESGLAERVQRNQHKLTWDLKSHRDFIVVGSGSSGERAGEILRAAHRIRLARQERE